MKNKSIPTVHPLESWERVEVILRALLYILSPLVGIVVLLNIPRTGEKIMKLTNEVLLYPIVIWKSNHIIFLIISAIVLIISFGMIINAVVLLINLGSNNLYVLKFDENYSEILPRKKAMEHMKVCFIEDIGFQLRGLIYILNKEDDEEEVEEPDNKQE